MKRRSFLRSAITAASAAALPRHAWAAGYLPAASFGQDLEAVTGDGQSVTLSASALKSLREALRGRLLLAGNDGYDQARRILNPSFDKRPALIVQPTGVADIRAAVNFARENRGLLLAVKCGGHSFSGHSTCDRGLQIDLSNFRAVRVDPKARRAWVTGGSLLGQVDHETQPFGLVTPLGTVSHTGVGGLVTGGGFGRVARRFGLSIDNLVSVDVVTADGELRHASPTENADLFWGVRGGGGNFGIVTNFEFQLHPMQQRVIAGQIFYPLSQAKEALKVYAEYGAQAPDELDIVFVMMQPPGQAQGTVGFGVCYSGPAAGAERALAPLRKIGTPLVDNVTAMNYVAVQKSGDIDDPRALGMYLKSGFVTGIPNDLINAIVDRFEPHPGRLTEVAFQMGGGAIARVPSDATAFAQREIFANMLGIVGWKFGDDPAPHVQWIRQYWEPLERFTYGFYVNDAGDVSATQIKASYRSNHERLVQIKNKYDPRNLFRLNANIRPAG